MSDYRTRVAHQAPVPDPHRASWSAIFAGTVIGLGIFVVLSLLGLGLGFALIDTTENSPMNGSITATGIWTFASQLIALGVGGYAAGRLAGYRETMGALLHGAAVWGLATLASVWLAVSAAGTAVNAVGSALSSLGSGVASAAQAVIPDDASLPDLSLSDLTLENLPEPVRNALQSAGITPDAFQGELQDAYRSVVSEQEQAQVAEDATDAAQAVVADPADAGEEIQQFLAETFGAGGTIGEEDRAAALDRLQSEFGLSDAEAEQLLTDVSERLQALRDQAAAAIDEARQAAAEAADAASEAAATAALLAGLASLLGLAAAAGGAVAGRRTTPV
ncbi:hypothetical protein [Wenxinia saemankumensis]|uniref:PhnA-like protein n=1 Tax=Wenxinia saemankumensis TaxID=1447782 RepID=A0A1M6EMT5_9RHOB|nr:hypothetical protein [Wenxinia saemankumensis]SHI86802.1 hypothetical protein SAMN05444417_2079 [Wenxinia saemankumensis]